MNCSRRRGKILSAASSFYYGFFFRGSFGCWGGFFAGAFVFADGLVMAARVKMIAVLLRRSLLSLLFWGFNFCSWHSFEGCFSGSFWSVFEIFCFYYSYRLIS